MNRNSIVTYVSFGEAKFIISTLERESSVLDHRGTFNETIVFENNEGKLGKILYMGEAATGSIATHQRFVEELHATGKVLENNP